MALSADWLSDDRRFIDRVRFQDGSNVTLEVIRSYIQDKADSYGIPIAFNADTVKTGSLFNKQSEDVLVLYNTQHPEYIKFIIRVSYQGTYAFLDVFQFGASKNIRNENQASGFSTGAIFKSLINSATGHKQKLEDENNYYTILHDCFMSLIE
ncbi:MAG: hypothetical protein II871_04530 [Clostridia bacterium]|nr:hypothetical protein [Clostridia bacterium]